MKKFWDKLLVLEDNFHFSCGSMTKYTCNFLNKAIEAKETKKLIQLINGLNKQYDSFKANLLSVELYCQC